MGEFDFASYKDRYRQKVKEAIAAKKKGETIEAPEDEDTGEVINLMEALKRSVSNVAKAKHRRKSPRKHSRQKKTSLIARRS